MTEGVRAEWLHLSRGMWLSVGVVLMSLLGGCTLSTSDVDPPPAVVSEPALSVSEKRVSAGDVIELHIEPPRKYTWGGQTSLEEWREGKWKAVYYWKRELVRKRELASHSLPAGCTPITRLAFGWDASFKIRIPDAAPGASRITKRFTSGPKGRDDTTAEVEISVVS